jgi:hypothetical protein
MRTAARRHTISNTTELTAIMTVVAGDEGVLGISVDVFNLEPNVPSLAVSDTSNSSVSVEAVAGAVLVIAVAGVALVVAVAGAVLVVAVAGVVLVVAVVGIAVVVLV